MATTYERQQYTTTTQPHYRQEHAGDRFGYPQHQYQQGQYQQGQYQQGQYQQGPSTSKIMTIMALLPVTGILLGLSGITLVGTIIGLAVATPLFVIFSPVIVPAILTIGLAVTGFLTSGTFGLTGLSSLSYLFNMLRQSTLSVPDQMDYIKGTLQNVGEYTGQKTKDLGQKIQHTAHEMGDQGQGQGQIQAGVHGQVGVGVGAGGKEGRKGGKDGDRS